MYNNLVGAAARERQKNKNPQKIPTVHWKCQARLHHRNKVGLWDFGIWWLAHTQNALTHSLSTSSTAKARYSIATVITSYILALASKSGYCRVVDGQVRVLQNTNPA